MKTSTLATVVLALWGCGEADDAPDSTSGVMTPAATMPEPAMGDGGPCSVWSDWHDETRNAVCRYGCGEGLLTAGGVRYGRLLYCLRGAGMGECSCQTELGPTVESCGMFPTEPSSCQAAFQSGCCSP